MRRPNLTRVLIATMRPIQEPTRTYFIHRPAKDFSPPAGGTLSSPSRQPVQTAAGIVSFVQRNSVPSLYIRCMITASRRASAPMAFCRPRRLAMFIAQAFSHDHFFTRLNMTWAAS